MKAASVGLELDVFLNNEEVEKLKDNSLSGKFRFREVNTHIQKEIPLEIEYNKKQQKYLEVKIIPDRTYFGEAEKVIFTINEHLYYHLLENKSCGDRFFGSGKLFIFAENIK
jgi:hypothetical protein